ncbi:helix-turn-helix transcriptional regulator [Marinomonas sp. CT5]|uniref:helix-turn-helix transcriptional regulator n=1 Tax=Marinomonas sp. CT5 TaxID=2066133 RepID=UPI001BAEA342|nr:helix-turn-helix transcriptional regulator [Marinomonas sp. CT5]
MNNQWAKDSAGLVEAIGCDEFATTLLMALKHQFHFDQAVIFGFEGSLPPTELISLVPSHKKICVVDNYVSGCYQLDPWFHAHINKQLVDGFYFLHEFAPDNFYQSQYFYEYYQRLEIEEEVVIVINLDAWQQIQISIGLLNAQVNPALYKMLRFIYPLLRATVKQHWGENQPFLRQTSEKNHKLIVHDHMSQVLKQFGCHTLTERERDVALLIIRGYSLKAISELLGIAFGTSKVHCKNLYKKLGINSQAELFAIFLDEILITSTPQSGERES